MGLATRFADAIRTQADNPLQLWLSNLVAGLTLYGGLLTLYFQNKWYLGFLDERTRMVMTGLLLFWFIWTVLGAYHWIFNKGETFRSLPLLFFDAFAELIRRRTLNLPQKTALLKIAVKGFFFPLMLHWLLGNFDNMVGVLQGYGFQTSAFLSGHLSQLAVFAQLNFNDWYRFTFDAFIFVDVMVFCFAYAVEADWLNNKIKSVEPTLLGWIVALLCYPPVNDLTGAFVSWHSNETAFALGPVWFDRGLHVLVLGLFAWYLWATLSLGARAGNLVNRGIVSRGAYRWTRHPAYFSKVTAWWIAGLPVIWAAVVALVSTPGWQSFIWLVSVLASIFVWTLIYGLRAWTEERHLSQDPDYMAYKKKVRHVAIPGLI